MGDFNPVLSNGTCWSNVNVRSVDDFIPCGNDAGLGQHFACCNRGDNCLSSNACYSSKYGSTYVAGCTDPGFGSAACPEKGDFYGQQWVGLVRCMVSDDDTKNDEEWAGCKESDAKGGLGVPDKCDCRGKTPLFKDNPTLTNIAHLPLGSLETISFYPGFEPASASDVSTALSTAATATTTPAPAGQSSTTGATDPAGLPTSDPTPTPSSGLSTAAQAGIGVGAGGGGLLLGCIILIVVLLRRRKKTGDDDREPTLPFTQIPPPLPRDDSNLGDASVSGFKSELAADEPSNTSASAPPSLRSPNTPNTPQQRYQAYNPDLHGNHARYSNLSDLSSARDGSVHGSSGPISAQSTGVQQGGDARPGQPSMGPIHELQG